MSNIYILSPSFSFEHRFLQTFITGMKLKLPWTTGLQTSPSSKEWDKILCRLTPMNSARGGSWKQEVEGKHSPMTATAVTVIANSYGTPWQPDMKPQSFNSLLAQRERKLLCFFCPKPFRNQRSPAVVWTPPLVSYHFISCIFTHEVLCGLEMHSYLWLWSQCISVYFQKWFTSHTNAIRSQKNISMPL